MKLEHGCCLFSLLSTAWPPAPFGPDPAVDVDPKARSSALSRLINTAQLCHLGRSLPNKLHMSRKVGAEKSTSQGCSLLLWPHVEAGARLLSVLSGRTFKLEQACIKILLPEQLAAVAVDGDPCLFFQRCAHIRCVLFLSLIHI